MKVTEKIGKTVEFGSLEPGDGFLSDGEAYIVVDGEIEGREIGVKLDDGTRWDFSNYEQVIPVDMEVKWRFKS